MKRILVILTVILLLGGPLFCSTKGWFDGYFWRIKNNDFFEGKSGNRVSNDSTGYWNITGGVAVDSLFVSGRLSSDTLSAFVDTAEFSCSLDAVDARLDSLESDTANWNSAYSTTQLLGWGKDEFSSGSTEDTLVISGIDTTSVFLVQLLCDSAAVEYPPVVRLLVDTAVVIRAVSDTANFSEYLYFYVK
ncbi:MAG: hypothetical protein B6D65_03205 [candidate division Zixibacteria bacterium 4484_93]|nr:MAG: hypothetical protein B6D65_03205 [candidate division Zixibacteria bacterium 4484_93]